MCLGGGGNSQAPPPPPPPPMPPPPVVPIVGASRLKNPRARGLTASGTKQRRTGKKGLIIKRQGSSSGGY